MNGQRTSTTVEIILYYLTFNPNVILSPSTTVEIILYYLTSYTNKARELSTTVEIILYYLTSEEEFKKANLQQ